MEYCKNCGEELNVDGTCPACCARLAQLIPQKEEQPIEVIKGVKPEESIPEQVHQNALGREQNSLGQEQKMPVRKQNSLSQEQKTPNRKQNSLGHGQNSLGHEQSLTDLEQSVAEDQPVKKNRKKLLWIVAIVAVAVLIGAAILLVVKTNGSCGANARWSFNIITGELTIQGSGEMYDYSNENPAPWKNLEVKSVTVDGVTSIGDHAFDRCYVLTEVTISDSVTSIGDHAFDGKGKLTEIMIPDSVTTIEDHAFAGCHGLTEIVIPDSVTTIGECAFMWCYNLTEVTIPDSVITVEGNAFNGCSRLTEVTILGSETTFELGAFAICDNLTDVYFAGTQEQWEGMDIKGQNDDLTNATIHFNS